MLDMNNSKQIAGGLFSSSRVEDSVKELNKTIKLELENVKKGQAHRFASRIRMEIDEKRSDIHDIINSDYNAKRQFYQLINQWAEKYGSTKIDNKPPFEVFLEDLQSVFGKNSENDLADEGMKTLYDDTDFYNALQPSIKEYVQNELKNMAQTDASKSQETIIHILEILTDNFTTLSKDPTVLRNLELCDTILRVLAVSAQKNPMGYMDTLAAIYKSMPTFRYACGEQKVIEMSLLWLEKDSATGAVKNTVTYSQQDYDLILKKLGTFDKLYIILPTLVNDRRMKNLLYGKDSKDNGKLVNWMKYVRQFLKTRKWDTKDGKEKGKYWKAFIDSYYNLVKFTFPDLFGTQDASVENVKNTGFFNILNVFSGKKKGDFNKIRNNLYAETINWLAIVRPHEYIRLLKASIDAFPDIVTHRSFPRASELDAQILGIFAVYIDKETGEPKKRGENDFEQMKKTFDNFGYLLRDHRKEGNLIDKIYTDIGFNRKFYRNLKKVVEVYEEEAVKFGFTLAQGEANWDSINADFYDKLFYSVINIDGIVLEDGIYELEDFVTHRLEIDSVEQFLPKKITGKYPMEDDQLIKYINDEKVGKTSIIRKESAKDPFQKVLLSLKKEFSNVNPKKYKNLLINGEIINPSSSLAWYMNTEFYTKKIEKQDPLEQIKTDIEGTDTDELEKKDRVEVRDLSSDIQQTEISQIVDDNLPEVSSLSNEITNLLKIIEEQGNHLNQTDTLIDQLILDESTLLDNVSTKIDDVNRMIQANDLDVYAKKNKPKTVTTTKTTQKTETTEVQDGGNIKKYYVGKYTTGNKQDKNLYKLVGKSIYYYINNFNKKKRVDINSSRITM